MEGMHEQKHIPFGGRSRGQPDCISVAKVGSTLVSFSAALPHLQ